MSDRQEELQGRVRNLELTVKKLEEELKRKDRGKF